MAQTVKIIDVTKSYLPVDPQAFPENLSYTAQEDTPEKGMPIIAYEGYNFLPTSYGYRSYFGTNTEMTLDAIPKPCDKVIVFQSKEYENMVIAFCSDGIRTARAGSPAWTLAVALTDEWFATQTYKEYTYCIIENNLYIYRQGHTHVIKIDDTLAVTTFIPTFLNMAGQMGIFRANGRLGFWDSENSVSWSSAFDLQDFEPSIENMVGNSTFFAVLGRIVTIVPHGEGFVIYATKSIVGVSYVTTSTAIWDAAAITSKMGISYAGAVTVGTTNKEHYVYTSAGIIKIGHYNALSRQYEQEMILAELYDYLKESRDPVYLECHASRYLHFLVVDDSYISGRTSFTDVTVTALAAPPVYIDKALYDSIDSQAVNGISSETVYELIDKFFKNPLKAPTVPVADTYWVLQYQQNEGWKNVFPVNNITPDFNTAKTAALAAFTSANINIFDELYASLISGVNNFNNSQEYLWADKYQSEDIVYSEVWLKIYNYMLNMDQMLDALATYEANLVAAFNAKTSFSTTITSNNQLVAPTVSDIILYVPHKSLQVVARIENTTLTISVETPQYTKYTLGGTIDVVEVENPLADIFTVYIQSGIILKTYKFSSEPSYDTIRARMFGSDPFTFNYLSGAYWLVSTAEMVNGSNVPYLNETRLIFDSDEMPVIITNGTDYTYATIWYTVKRNNITQTPRRYIPSYDDFAYYDTYSVSLLSGPISTRRYILPGFLQKNIQALMYTNRHANTQYILNGYDVRVNIGYGSVGLLDVQTLGDRVLYYGDNYANDFNIDGETLDTAYAFIEMYSAYTGQSTLSTYTFTYNPTIGIDINTAPHYETAYENKASHRMVFTYNGTLGSPLGVTPTLPVKEDNKYKETTPFDCELWYLQVKEGSSTAEIFGTGFMNHTEGTMLNLPVATAVPTLMEIQPCYPYTSGWKLEELTETLNPHPSDFTYPGTTYILQDGAPVPAYPTFAGSIVFDIELKKWGKQKNALKSLVELAPLNSVQNAQIPYTNFGMDSGVLKESGKLAVFSPNPTDSFMRYGKIGLYRLGFTEALEIILHFRTNSTGSVVVDGSTEGRDIEPNIQHEETFTNVRQYIVKCHVNAMWHTISLHGNFDLQFMEFRGIIGGRR